MNTEELRRVAEAGYDQIDRYLRNNLGDDDYAEYSAALDAACQTDHLAALEAENAALRRRWCLDVCPSAYMDDGEAQDSTEHPSIDYLRDSLETIAQKRRTRYAARSKT